MSDDRAILRRVVAGLPRSTNIDRADRHGNGGRPGASWRSRRRRRPRMGLALLAATATASLLACSSSPAPTGGALGSPVFSTSPSAPASLGASKTPRLTPPPRGVPIDLHALPGRIAFSDGDINTVSANGSGFARRTSEDVDQFDPSWSPDGKRIAYRSAPDANLGNAADIFVLDLSSGVKRNLTHDPAAFNWSPAWSPDGKQIAFSSHRSGDPNQNLYLMNPDGSHLVNLTMNRKEGEYPTWSPDGRQIAFGCYIGGGTRPGEEPDYDICLINRDGTGLRDITNNKAYDMSPAWSPDGLQIAFESQRDSPPDFKPPADNDEVLRDSDIFIMRPDGSSVRNITDDLASNDLFPTWAPDGTALVYMSNPSSALFVVRPDGSGRTRLGTVLGDFPDWGR